MYAYYSGVDEVAHAYGLETRFYPAELAAADRLVGDAARRAARRRRARGHRRPRQVNVGHESWIGLAPLDEMVDDVRGRRPLPLPPRAAGGAAEELHAAAEELHAAAIDAWVFARDQLLDEGWLGPDPAGPRVYRRVGDVVLAARDAVGFVDPTLPHEAQLRSARTARSPPPRCRSRCSRHGQGVSRDPGSQ